MAEAIPFVQMGLQGYGAVKDSEAQRALGEYQKKMYETNAKIAELQGEEAIAIGDREANAHGRKISALKGSQKVAYAAQGIDVNSGVAKEVMADTHALGELDKLKIKGNAWRQAWGFKVQAQDYRQKGEYAKMAGEAGANATLLGGGLKALEYGVKGVQGLGK